MLVDQEDAKSVLTFVDIRKTTLSPNLNSSKSNGGTETQALKPKHNSL